LLTSVYYIPRLKSNIISLGQLEEGGCDIRLFAGHLTVLDPECNLLVSALRTGNRLYTVKLGVVAPVCLVSKMNNLAWTWHARFGHLNFRALRDLGRRKMVEGTTTATVIFGGQKPPKISQFPPKISYFRRQKAYFRRLLAAKKN
jgi:hypothetical protein